MISTFIIIALCKDICMWYKMCTVFNIYSFHLRYFVHCFALENNKLENFYVLLTVHLSIFILVINQIDAQNFVLQ